MPPRPQIVERLVGLFILVPLALVVFLVIGLAREKGWFERWVTIQAPFPPETIVPVGAKVTFGGKEIGRVKSVTTDERRRTIAILLVRQSLAKEIKSDSTASLVRPNFIGDPVVNISFGTTNGAPVQDKGRIAMKVPRSDEPGDITPDSMRELFYNLLQLAKNANLTLTQMMDPNGPMQRLITNGDKLLADLVAAEERLLVLMREQKALEKELTDRLVSVLGQVNKRLVEVGTPFPIEHKGGEIVMRLNPKLEAQVDELMSMAHRLDKLLSTTEKNQSTVGLLLSSREFYDKTLELITDLKSAVNDIRELMANLRKISPDLAALVTSGRTMLDRGSRLLKGLESNPFLGGLPPPPKPAPPKDVELRYNTYESAPPPAKGGK